MLEFVKPKLQYTADRIVGSAELLSCTECRTEIKHILLYQNQIIPVKYTSFNTYEHEPRIFRHLCNI